MLYRTEGAALFQSPGPPVFCPGTPFGALRAGITIRAGAGTPDSLRPREVVSRTNTTFWVLPAAGGEGAAAPPDLHPDAVEESMGSVL